MESSSPKRIFDHFLKKLSLCLETVLDTVMDSALHELKDRIDKDPKYKDVKNWLESLPKI